MINRNAGTLRPVSPCWIRHQLPIAGQRIRQDRILSEADATSGDIRALCDLFGISIADAYRYSANASSDANLAPEPEPVGPLGRDDEPPGERGIYLR